MDPIRLVYYDIVEDIVAMWSYFSMDDIGRDESSDNNENINSTPSCFACAIAQYYTAYPMVCSIFAVNHGKSVRRAACMSHEMIRFSYMDSFLDCKILPKVLIKLNRKIAIGRKYFAFEIK